MNVIAIIQARMGASRLPGKVMLNLCHQPVLWHVYQRVKQSKKVDLTAIATTTKVDDDKIYEFCQQNNLPCTRGSQEDVLERYYQSAKFFNADIVVRITADCPMIDPLIIDKVVNMHVEGDYEVTGLTGEFPDGLDVEVFNFEALTTAWHSAKLPSEREHIGQYFYNNPEKFKLGSYIAFTDKSEYRWTLDHIEDFEFINQVYTKLYHSNHFFNTNDIFKLLESNPELMTLNSNIIRNEGLIKSLEREKNYQRSNIK